MVLPKKRDKIVYRRFSLTERVKYVEKYIATGELPPIDEVPRTTMITWIKKSH
jgi:hypothetical protein